MTATTEHGFKEVFNASKENLSGGVTEWRNVPVLKTDSSSP
jgi:hypothetical protein